MARIGYIVLVFCLFIVVFCFAQEQGLLIDDFELAISGGSDGTVDFGAGGGSVVYFDKVELIRK